MLKQDHISISEHNNYVLCRNEFSNNGRSMLDKNSNGECFILNFRVLASINQKEDKMSARTGKKERGK